MLFNNQRLGKYNLSRLIAGGGMADVYMACMTGPYGFKKPVALKLMHKQISSDQSFVNMFIDEARINARLVHPNIVQIVDFGEIDKTLYIAMEYIDGVDLSEFISSLMSSKIQPNINISIYVIAEILKAICYTASIKDFDGNSAGIVHRDITPHNILLSFDGDVKLTDFGIAKARGSVTTTVAGTLKGKLRYMSPEQARGETLDNRSDLYSIALILYELITHRQAYAGDTDMTLLKQVQASMIDCRPSLINPSVSPELEAVVVKALSAMPDDRFQTPESFQQTLFDLCPDAAFSRTMVSDLVKNMFRERMTLGLIPGMPFSDQRYGEGGRKESFRLKAITKYSGIATLILGLMLGFILLFVYVRQPALHRKPRGISPGTAKPVPAVKPPETVLKENKVLKGSTVTAGIKGMKTSDPVSLYRSEHTARKINDVSQAVMVINAVPWARVYIADAVSKRFIGITPIPRYNVRPGEYALLFKNKVYGTKVIRITLLAGKKKTIILRYDPEKKDFKTTIQ